MSFRASEEYLAPSEDSSFCQPGSVLFSQPSEVDNWCQSVPFQGGFPLTPPDTASECSLTEYPDMNGQSWTSLPEESWHNASAPEHSTWMQSSNSEWHAQGAPVTTQDLHTLDASSWLNISQGPVDLGLSPVLSQESQSSHAFHSISEPEIPLLPAGLDLSFIAESGWDAPGSVVYSSPHVTQDYSIAPELPSGMSVGPIHPGYHIQTPTLCGPQQPVFHFQGGQAPFPRRTASDPSFVQRRPLLPRTEGPLLSNVQSHDSSRALQPQSPAGRTDSAASVSNTQGQSQGPVIAGSPTAQAPTPCARIPFQGVSLSPRPDSAPVTRPSVSSQGYQDPHGFVQYEQEGKLSPVNTSYSYGSSNFKSGQPDMGVGKVDQHESIPSNTMSSATASVASEGDEGRHRNHPLYSEGPQPDGLYHCPFKSDPNCQHKPTKLKCNYDKFVDSHLKPFRCKIEACSKQEFSSTACLLRHEREAHGMHGHGDRPHLCFYPGCERGIPGNGFPRRYNLFDHMKRVHDHKEEPAQTIDSSEPTGSRKAGGRKRKAPASVSEESAPRRSKLQHVQQPSPPLSLPPNGPLPHVGHIPELSIPGPQDEQHRQHAIYSQWADQRELLEFQMNYVRNPGDEVNFQRHLEELHRLSHQTRHG